MRLPTRMLVVQPTPFCNIDCDYCYLRSRADRSLMAAETVQAIADRIVAALDPDIDTLVVWHAGEPTTAPLAWYRSAVRVLGERKRGRPLSFSVQTNGIGLDEHWAEFLGETSTNVGLSLDGPEDLHNLHRRTRSGKPTWHLTMRGLETLRRHEIEPGIITVLTADSLDRADEMFHFFQRHRLLRLSFSVEEREGANLRSSLDFPGVERAMEDFLLRFMQLVVQTGTPMHVREAERILDLMASGADNTGRNEMTTPLAALTVAWDGGVYTYSPEFPEHASGDWRHLLLGNIRTQTLESIVAGEAFSRLKQEVEEGLAGCARDCAFWSLCGGGSPVNRLAEHGTLAVAETQFCRLTVQATTRALRRLLVSPQAAPAMAQA